MPLTELICRRSGYKNAPLCYSDQVLIMDCSCSSSSQWSSLLTCLSCQRAQLHRLTSQTIHQNQHSFSHTYTSHLHLPYLVLTNKTYVLLDLDQLKGANQTIQTMKLSHMATFKGVTQIVENTLHIKYWRLARIPHIGATLHGGKKELHGRLTRSITLCHEKQPQYHHHCHHMLPPVKI